MLRQQKFISFLPASVSQRLADGTFCGSGSGQRHWHWWWHLFTASWPNFLAKFGIGIQFSEFNIFTHFPGTLNGNGRRPSLAASSNDSRSPGRGPMLGGGGSGDHPPPDEGGSNKRAKQRCYRTSQLEELQKVFRSTHYPDCFQR